MKRIIKKEPAFFSNYISNKKTTSWQELSRDIGNDVRVYMLSGMTPDNCECCSEQNYQCAYTELNIEPEATYSHIDHFKKRSIFKETASIFDWFNLFTASNHEDYGAKYKDKNIRKQDYKHLINPAFENPADYFTYNLLGDIVIKSKNKSSIEYLKAKKTIDLFNLQDKSLIEQRKSVAMQVKAMCKQLSLDDIKNEIGRFDSFVEFSYNAYNQVL